MGVSAIVQDGEIVKSAAQKSAESASKSTPDGYDKNAFLQLLVAQMKYQDPLEPTDNSEYITQYATFSQVESLQNMASNMDLSRASSMVGQTVEVATEENGKTTTVKGVVDYVTYEGGKAYVSINGESYAASDVARIIDQTYDDATELADSFMAGMEKLPTLNNLSIADHKSLQDLLTLYNGMSSYAQGFVDENYSKLLESYVERMDELLNIAEAQTDAAQTETSDPDTDTAADDTTIGTVAGSSAGGDTAIAKESTDSEKAEEIEDTNA